MIGTRPRVFVSSTIFDFRDLRSALKFWLDELGYDAQLSEYNDFSKPLDENTYTACLRGVEAADYFVLLIGARVGGFVDAASRISITRSEYRCAYDSFKKTGRPRIVVFIRSDVWTVRADRDDLERLLANDEALQAEVSPESRASLAKHPSRVVNNAAAIFEFIDEVGRKHEMKDALRDGTELPRGNWLHVFNGFEDIVAVLRRDIRLGSVGKAALEANLRAELIDIASALTIRDGPDEEPVPQFLSLTPVRALLGNKANPDAAIMVNGNALAHCGLFCVLGSSCTPEMTTNAIEESIRSGEFLEWLPEANFFRPNVLHRSIVRLRDEIARLRRGERAFADPSRRDEAARWYASLRGSRRDIRVKVSQVVPYCGMHDRHENILSLAAAIHAGLNDNLDACRSLRLWPPTPFEGPKRQLYVTTGQHQMTSWLDGHATAIVRAAAAAGADMRPTEG